MEVRPGYRQTEVGVIPEDWDAVDLQAVCSMKSGEGITSASIDDFSEYPCFGGNGLRGYTSRFTHDGTFALIGRQGALCGNVVRAQGKLFASEHAVVVTARPGTDIAFLTYLLGRMHLNRYSESSAQPGLSVSKLLKLALAVPPSEAEQRAIAAALSDVDALLGGLDRLIAKKRDLKQAAMQQLLTGQTRLPGFSGEWEETKFDKVVRHHAGNSTLIKGKLPSSEAAGLFPAYSASGQDVWCDHFEHEGDAIVVSAVGSRCGKAFAASGRWCAIANTHVVWPNPAKIDGRFLGYFINDEDFWQKSGTGQPFVLFAKTFARPLRLPALPEQTAIAAVLSDIDAELAALETRRDKTRDLKQAMMQELLTGKTRLVPAGAAHA